MRGDSHVDPQPAHRAPRDRTPDPARADGPDRRRSRSRPPSSHAGGLGLIGGGYGDPDWIETEWANAGNARIGCGFITWSLAKRPEALTAALAHMPAAIMLSFGDPGPFAAIIRAAGAKLICQVQSVNQARQASKAGADVIVAQGAEAGGHGMTRAVVYAAAAGGGRLPRYAGRRRRRHRRRPWTRRRADARRRRRADGHTVLRFARGGRRRGGQAAHRRRGRWRQRALRGVRHRPRQKLAGTTPAAACATRSCSAGSAARTN